MIFVILWCVCMYVYRVGGGDLRGVAGFVLEIFVKLLWGNWLPLCNASGNTKFCIKISRS